MQYSHWKQMNVDFDPPIFTLQLKQAAHSLDTAIRSKIYLVDNSYEGKVSSIVPNSALEYHSFMYAK